MKTLLVTGLAVLSVILAPVASADTDQDYLNDLHSHGYSNTNGDQAELRMAHQICNIRNFGLSEQQTVEHLSRQAPTLSQEQLLFLVQTAEKYYCPNVPMHQGITV